MWVQRWIAWTFRVPSDSLICSSDDISKVFCLHVDGIKQVLWAKLASWSPLEDLKFLFGSKFTTRHSEFRQRYWQIQQRGKFQHLNCWTSAMMRFVSCLLSAVCWMTGMCLKTKMKNDLAVQLGKISPWRCWKFPPTMTRTVFCLLSCLWFSSQIRIASSGQPVTAGATFSRLNHLLISSLNFSESKHLSLVALFLTSADLLCCCLRRLTAVNGCNLRSVVMQMCHRTCCTFSEVIIDLSQIKLLACLAGCWSVSRQLSFILISEWRVRLIELWSCHTGYQLTRACLLLFVFGEFVLAFHCNSCSCACFLHRRDCFWASIELSVRPSAARRCSALHLPGRFSEIMGIVQWVSGWLTTEEDRLL